MTSKGSATLSTDDIDRRSVPPRGGSVTVTRKHRSPSGNARRLASRVGMALLSGALVLGPLLGCAALLDIHDVSLDEGGGGGGGQGGGAQGQAGFSLSLAATT